MKSFLQETILAAGKLTLEYREKLKELQISQKGTSNDLVSEADVAVEEFISERIRHAWPDHGMLGEEKGEQSGNGYRWIIDPIDGTTSFLYGQPSYSVSIALEHNGQIELGGVYLPVFDELFLAERGRGATLNDKPIHVAGRTDLLECVMATGFACLRGEADHHNMPYFNALIPQIREIRRFGSAAMDMCYVACGRLDGYWELHLNIYDVAAGCLILSEAGGLYSDFAGKLDNLYKEIAAANPAIHAKLIAQLSKIKSEHFT